ncbi:MAG: 50S ribosomal protein L10 [Patescibacteria group bacterium]|nr:50S ribosomal protein L10 [Patescibacteria group bacterium]
MALTKTQKQKILEDLEDKIARQKAIIFIDFTGLKVKDLSVLRRKLKMADCELKVAKKTLMRIAFKKAKIEIEIKKLPGEVALVFGYKEVITPAKIVYQFTEMNPNLKILGGFFENKFRELEEIITLAQLPTREELLVKLVGSIQAPISNFVRILEANIKGLIYVLSKVKT